MQVCNCRQCRFQLTKPFNQKLQIWYGRGSTGKSTLLQHLVRTVGRQNVICKDGVNKNKVIDCIIAYIERYMYGPNVKKYIIVTNTLPENITDFLDFVDLVHFRHVFGQRRLYNPNRVLCD